MRFPGLLALLGTATLALAQDRPAATPLEAAQLAEKRANEWSTLASSLEQRVARLLPCDPRVRSDIEEVSRASDARFAALTAYWQEIAKRSNDQAEAARKLIASNGARIADWKADRADSEQEQTRLAAETSDLRESAGQQAALATAARVLNGISQSATAATRQAAAREEAATKLDSSLQELIVATEARQTAIESGLKALATENNRWSAYYSARITRALMECSLTAPGGTADPVKSAPVKPAKTIRPAVTNAAGAADPATSAAAEPAKTTSPVATKRPATGQIYLQLYATSQRDAEIKVDALRKKGFGAMASEIQAKPGTFRVLAGPVMDAGIDKMRADLQAAGFPGKAAVRRAF